MPLADAVVMVRATHFGANPETLDSNAFQAAASDAGAARRALQEQAQLAQALRGHGVEVLLLDPPEASRSPDGVFPNNWFSTHRDGRLALYPMLAPSRRTERRHDLAEVFSAHGRAVTETVDVGAWARDGECLEGTGSLVLDRAARIAYASRSSRTDEHLARRWAERFGYRLHLFDAVDPQGRPVYHTNVVLSLGAGLAIVCLDAVPDAAARARLRESLENDGLEVLAIRWQQVRAFAGNQLFLRGRNGPLVALSASADRSLDPAQHACIDRHAQRMVADIATIERHGGGSVRCMLAEVFLPRAGASTEERGRAE